jgi:hypothetical protein
MEKKAIYLEGPLAHATDDEAYGWREKFETELSDKYILINPLKSVGDFRQELNKLRQELNANWPDKEAHLKFKKLMNECVINPDLADIVKTDIEVAYIPKNIPSFGTICGFFYFKKVLKKSLAILITGKDEDKNKNKTIIDCNNWEVGLADEIFYTFDDAIEYLKKL